MRAAGVAPNVISFNAAISACEKGGQWQRALSLLEEMRAAGVTPNVISFSAAISACEKGGQWQRALSLLEEMRAAGVTPNVISFNAAILACAAGSQPSAARQIFAEASRCSVLNRISYNAVLDAVCTAHPTEACELFLRGVSDGFYVDFERTERRLPLLDLHDFSEGAAETAVRWWITERVPARNPSSEKLIIVTGWGKTRGPLKKGNVRERVKRVLADMGVTRLPSDNPGSLLIAHNSTLSSGARRTAAQGTRGP
jgi:pentatricopeptide repeat protein